MNCYNITNYITLGKNILGTSIRLGGDPLSNLQRNLGFYAPGKYIEVESNSYTLDHSINFLFSNYEKSLLCNNYIFTTIFL